MNKRNKIALASLWITTSMTMAACQNQTVSTPETSPPAAGETSKPAAEKKPASEPGTFPLSEEKTTLKVLAVQSPFVEDYETNAFTKEYEELTNVKVEWTFATPQERQELLNLALTSGDLPDVIVGFGVSPAQQMVYGQQGLFLPLNDLIETYGVETKKLFERYPEVKKATTVPDGKIYSLSTIDRNPHTLAMHKMWIYTPWLEKLNLSMPTTTDEFYNVLKAFKTMDPNGNGAADEIPMTGGIQEELTNVDSFLMNSFIYNKVDKNVLPLIMNESGTIDTSANKEEYKEGLRYLNKLYAEGLITSEAFTQNNDQIKALVENGEPKVGAVSAFVFAQFADVSKERWLDYQSVPPLKGPAGVQQTPYLYYSHGGGNFLITSSAKNPELAFRWMDALFNEELNMRANIGSEGVGWKKPESGELGLNGEPASWIRSMSFGTMQNDHWMQTTPYHFSREMFESLAAGPKAVPRVLYEATKNNYEPYKTSIEQEVPPIFFNEQQAAEISGLQKTLKDYANEMKTRFIIGDASIDKEWDKYVSTLEGMNLKRYLEIYNEAYQAQYK